MLMLNSGKPIKVAHLQKLASQSMLNGVLVIEDRNGEQFFQWNQKNFSLLIKQGTL